MANSIGYHEAEAHLTSETLDMHRALASLQEELEAVDWYQQRINATGDAELRAILQHNRNEEQEHAAMVLEWIRRRDPGFDARLRQYLFTEGAITAREEAAAGNETKPVAAVAMSVGSLRGGRR